MNTEQTSKNIFKLLEALKTQAPFTYLVEIKANSLFHKNNQTI